MNKFQQYRLYKNLVFHATKVVASARKVWKFLYKFPVRLIRRYDRIKDIANKLDVEIPKELVKMEV